MRSPFVPARRTDPERMDGEGQAARELEEALADIRRVNSFLGGSSALLACLSSAAERGGWSGFSLLDVGTGSADIPSRVLERATRKRWSVRAAGVDVHPDIVRIARRTARGVEILRADGRALPFRDGAFDVVTASLFLHHFSAREAALLLRELHRVARRLVIVNDLERHLLPYLAIRALGAIARASSMFRHDAPLSVLRGFTPEELAGIARSVGLESRFRILRRAPFRLLLLVEKDAE